MKPNDSLFNILYIEDDKITQKITSLMLKNLCSELILAEDGLDAILKFKKNSFDLIITDLSMPNINGTNFIKMVREIDTEIPIIILSAHINEETLQESVNYGIQGYIKKPIDYKLLEMKINEVKEQSQQKFLRKEYHRLTNASAIITRINNEGIITYVNEKYCQLSGFSKEELIGQKHSLIKSQVESPNFFKSVWHKIAAKKEIWTGILKHTKKSGELYYLKTTIQPILNKHGNIEQFITLSIPVTDIIHHEKQLSDYFKEHQKSILLLVQIEEFKYLKRSFTHKITNRLQKLFAKELLKHMPKECHFENIYILNNGRFAFIKAHNELVNEELMTNILQTFQQEVNSKKIKIGIVDYTLSIVCSLAYGEDALENAKIGLTKILKNKKDFIIAKDFLKETQEQSHAKLDKLMMIKEAIDSYKIISHFQPIVDNKTREVVKYESLVRLIDKNNKIISPYFFLDLAKEGKYYHEITAIVLHNSFRALFNNSINISINLSALDMEDKKTKDLLFQLLEKYRTETHRITIEIVEDEEIKDKASMQKFIEKVKQYGIKIALDDFGKGFSNFSRIQSYKPDYIKIDGSLIRNIENDKFSKDLVETIVYFAKKQNIKTIAEFVENENIYNIIRDLGVDYSQGHYFAKAGKLEELLSSSL